MQDTAKYPRHDDSASANGTSLTLKFLFLIGGVMVALTLTALTPVLPQIDADLAHSPTDHLLVKLLVTITGATMVFGAATAGFLIDRIGVRSLLASSAAIFALAGTAGLYLASLEALLVSRLFVGLSAAAMAAISMTLINTRLEGNDRSKWMGAHVAVATISGLIFQPSAGALGELGWRWPFLLYLAGIAVLIVALGLKSEHRPRKQDPVTTKGAREPLLNWFPVRFAFLAFCLGSITYLPVVYLPFLVRQAGITSPFIISLVGLGDTLMTVIFALLFARARRSHSSQRLFAFSFACAGIGLSIAALLPTFWTIVAGMMVFGLGLGWFVPNLMTAAGDCVRPDQQGRTVGIVKGAHYIAAPACVIIVEPVAQQFGPQGAIMVAATLALGLLAIFIGRLATMSTVQSDYNRARSGI